MAARESVSVRIYEGQNGSWSYAVITGSGSEPGSLKAWESCNDIEEAFSKGQRALEHSLEIRDCEHIWEQDSKITSMLQCDLCGAYQPRGGWK